MVFRDPTKRVVRRMSLSSKDDTLRFLRYLSTGNDCRLPISFKDFPLRGAIFRFEHRICTFPFVEGDRRATWLDVNALLLIDGFCFLFRLFAALRYVFQCRGLTNDIFCNCLQTSREPPNADVRVGLRARTVHFALDVLRRLRPVEEGG